MLPFALLEGNWHLLPDLQCGKVCPCLREDRPRLWLGIDCVPR